MMAYMASALKEEASLPEWITKGKSTLIQMLLQKENIWETIDWHEENQDR